ncbi:hypothetical protein [Devosia sediminis]|uniref:Uncharacterized protein n=1 Tax=Devosia sediminis TaxID=2798801 RepID=A0A934IVN8_9HYPH|nr:hypothetical protein [Devosia sediminis]MBJ3783850.1 hypothetical protein [Devosia sediminis]
MMHTEYHFQPKESPTESKDNVRQPSNNDERGRVIKEDHDRTSKEDRRDRNEKSRERDD